MKKYLIALIFLATTFKASAQKDTIRTAARIIKTPSISQRVVLDSVQEKWLYKNYTSLGKLSIPDAKIMILRAFPSITESTLEYLISQAGKMLKGDQGKDLDKLRQDLEILKRQKEALLNKITEKETELNNTTDERKRAAISNEIMVLKKQLVVVNRSITAIQEKIRRDKKLTMFSPGPNIILLTS